VVFSIFIMMVMTIIDSFIRICIFPMVMTIVLSMTIILVAAVLLADCP